MKKWFWIAGFAILIVVAGIFARPYLLILSGYGAKNLCSCVYNSGRNPESVIANELGNFPLSLGTFTLNRNDSTATGSVMGFAKRKAVYKKGEGCTLLVDYSSEEFRNKKSLPLKLSAQLSDTILWPYGKKIVESYPPLVRFVRLKEVVDAAFTEKEGVPKKNTRGVVIVYKGQLIFERYSEEFAPDTPQMGWSMSKSVTNALIGILVKQGRLDIYGPAPVDQWSYPSDPRRAITVDELLRMSSGLEWTEDYGSPSSATRMLFMSHDIGEYTASLPLEAQPDQHWEYSSGTTNLISKIIKDITGDDYLDFVDRELLTKLGITSAVWEKDESGTLVGSSFMWASPRDWAKLGLLFLNDGLWNGERILPEGWVLYSSTQTPAAERGYGAHFWLNTEVNGRKQYKDAPPDLYGMHGFEDQRVFIIPSKEMVIVRLGQTGDESFDFNLFLKGILEAFPD